MSSEKVEKPVSNWPAVVVIGGFVAMLAFAAFLFLNPEKGETAKACHASIQDQANYAIDVKTTKSTGSSVEGIVHLQNGFGAWTPYDYRCGYNGRARLSER